MKEKGAASVPVGTPASSPWLDSAVRKLREVANLDIDETAYAEIDVYEARWVVDAIDLLDCYRVAASEVTQLSRAYENVKREPRDGSLIEAIRVHSQACGLIAFVFDVHPDRVAEAVRDAALTTSSTPPEPVRVEATPDG